MVNKLRFDAEIDVDKVCELLNIPRIFRNRTLDSFNGLSKRDHNILTEKIIVVICGNTGLGKTHIGVGYLKDRFITSNYQKSGHYVRLNSLMIALRSCFQQGSETTEAHLVNLYCGYDILVIDEFDKANFSAYVKASIFEILLQRYENGLKTIVITNYDRDKLDHLFGAPILDRIHKKGGIIELKGESKR